MKGGRGEKKNTLQRQELRLSLQGLQQETSSEPHAAFPLHPPSLPSHFIQIQRV